MGRVQRVIPPRLAGLLALVSLWLHRLRGEAVGVVLLYHRVAPVAGDPRRELLPAVATGDLADQLRWLGRRYRIVPAADILEAAAARRRFGRVPVAVTFDDDPASHLEHALPVLRAAGVRATFFLTGASLDGPRHFWWQHLQAALDAGLDVGQILPGDDVHAMGQTMECRSSSERAAATAALAALGAAPGDGGMARAAVRALAAEQDVGFHTRDHDVLTGVDETALAEALRVGRTELESTVGRELTTLAYPHGAAGAREASAARAAGFRRAFVTIPSACHPATDPHLVGRLEPGPVPLGTFALAVERALVHPR